MNVQNLNIEMKKKRFHQTEKPSEGNSNKDETSPLDGVFFVETNSINKDPVQRTMSQPVDY